MKKICLIMSLVLPPVSFAWGTFKFIAMGDVPYVHPEGTKMFQQMINKLNARGSFDFVIHVGDIKSGGSSCADKNLLRVRNLFNSFNKPLYYTPGDNEWTDCHRNVGKSMDPVKRLQFIRKNFFTNHKSLGKTKVRFESQAKNKKYKKYVENYLFKHQDGLFASLHVVGSNNNLRPENEAAVKEYQARQLANLFWLDEIFKQAQKSKFLVLFFHAELSWGTNKSHTKGFLEVKKKISKFAKSHKIPSLLIHGDDHKFKVDNPIQFTDKVTGFYGRLPHITRLEVPGFPTVGAVEVSVDPELNQPFSFKPLTTIPMRYRSKSLE